MNWDVIKPYLDAAGVQPWMYGILVSFGILHQYAAGSFKWWSRELSFVSAVLWAVACSAVPFFEGDIGLGPAGLRLMTLTGACLLTEGFMNRYVAPNVKFMPTYNEWTSAGSKPTQNP